MPELFSSQRTRRRRNTFRLHPEPVGSMSTRKRPSASAEPPSDLAGLARWFATQQDARERFRWVLRDSLDELLDGGRTGRWAYQHLSKTEKAHLGTVVEVNLTKEFGIADGDDLDWRVAGSDLDCKFSKDIGGWEIPMEMYQCGDHGDRSGRKDHPALLVWLCDDTSEWAVGLFRATDVNLKWKADKDDPNTLVRAYNRDNKRRLGAGAIDEVHWLWGGVQSDLPENTLLQMDPDRRRRILVQKLSGQQRVNALFRENLGEVMRRPIVCTVAQQDDAPKRARDARKNLRPEGVLVLGHQEAHPPIAKALGLPIPQKGEWVAVRVSKVTPEASRPDVYFENAYWAVADELEAPAEAPVIPRHKLPQRPLGSTQT